MPASVAEYAGPLISSAHCKKRYSEGGSLDMVAHVRNGRRRNENARHRAQRPQLHRETLWVQVVFDRFSPSITLVGGTGVDMSKDAPNNFSIIRDHHLSKRLRRGAHGLSVSHLYRHASIN